MRSKQIKIHDLKVKTSAIKVQYNFVIDKNDELYLHFCLFHQFNVALSSIIKLLLLD